MAKPPRPQCQIDGCSKLAESKGRDRWNRWCSMHRDRYRRYGNPLALVRPATGATNRPETPVDDAVPFEEAVERFADIIDIRIRDRPRDAQLRIAHSERRQPYFEPFDRTWLRLYVEVDDWVDDEHISPVWARPAQFLRPRLCATEPCTGVHLVALVG